MLTDAECMGRLRWAENVTFCWILDTLMLLLGPEVIGLAVCLHIE